MTRRGVEREWAFGQVLQPPRSPTHASTPWQSLHIYFRGGQLLNNFISTSELGFLLSANETKNLKFTSDLAVARISSSNSNMHTNVLTHNNIIYTQDTIFMYR